MVIRAALRCLFPALPLPVVGREHICPQPTNTPGVVVAQLIGGNAAFVQLRHSAFNRRRCVYSAIIYPPPPPGRQAVVWPPGHQGGEGSIPDFTDQHQLTVCHRPVESLGYVASATVLVPE